MRKWINYIVFLIVGVAILILPILFWAYCVSACEPVVDEWVWSEVDSWSDVDYVREGVIA